MFHANVPTRASAESPSVSNAPPRRRVRSAQAAYVVRSRPFAVAVTIVLAPKSRSARWKTWVRDSGASDMSPRMGETYAAGAATAARSRTQYASTSKRRVHLR